MRVRLAAPALFITLTAVPAFSQAPNPDRKAYFGEQHVHTSWSVDAWLFGNHLTGPDAALKYAQGEAIKHPLGYDIKIEQPLDWMGVTDHSEYVGITKMANTPGSARQQAARGAAADPQGPERSGRRAEGLHAPGLAHQPAAHQGLHEPGGGGLDLEGERPDRRREQQAGQIHRVLLLRIHLPVQLPQPASQRLFPRLRQGGGASHSRPSTPGIPKICGSGWTRSARPATSCWPSRTTPTSPTGWMYPIDVDSFGRPIDAAWAASRDRNERLVEIKQIKGQSETHPLLSPNDEFANYEITSFLIGLPCGVGPHRPHRRQLRAPGAEGRPRRCRTRRATTPTSSASSPVRTRTTAGCPTARTTSSAATASTTARSRRACPGTSSVGVGCAPREPGGPLRHLGRGEHARLALGRDVPQGDLRDERHRASRSASSAAGTTARTSSPPATGSRRPMPAACRWAATCRPARGKAPTFVRLGA